MDVREVAKQLGIHSNSLYRWVQEYEEYGESAFPGRGCRIYDYQAEIYRLQRKNRDLEERKEVRFEYLKRHRGEFRCGIEKACSTLGISRGGYYEYLRRKPSRGQVENEFLGKRIQELFLRHEGRYGALRISLALHDEGIEVNHKRCGRIMRSLGLYAKGTRRTYRRYHKKTNNKERPNLLNRVFESDGRNRIWVGDMTCISTKEGFLYLAVMMDIFSRKVVGWSMGKRMSERLVMDALNQAYGREHPRKGFIVHTDQGSQYTGFNFRALTSSLGGQCSNSRKGNPYDNAMMESFYRTLKREQIDGKNYQTREEAEKDVFKYIELYYNTQRKHSGLGYLSPGEFEMSNT